MGGAPRSMVLAVVACVIAACSSAKISLGDDGSGLRDVNPDEVVVAARACPTGAAHPNVCCSGDTCRTRDSAPFHACASTDTAYPDGLRCCSLDDPTACTACDPSQGMCGTSNSGAGFAPPPATSVLGTTCEHCPPGFTGTSVSQGGCCKSGSNGFCEGSAGCAGDGCPKTQEPCAPTCAAGFSLTMPQADVCCRVAAGVTDCYVWLPGDATALSCGGAASECACRRNDGARALQMDCDDVSSTCTCSIDGAPGAPVALARAACTTQDTRAAAWVDACHFAR